jgi:hypothetical protein
MKYEVQPEKLARDRRERRALYPAINSIHLELVDHYYYHWQWVGAQKLGAKQKKKFFFEPLGEH